MSLNQTEEELKLIVRFPKVQLDSPGRRNCRHCIRPGSPARWSLSCRRVRRRRRDRPTLRRSSASRASLPRDERKRFSCPRPRCCRRSPPWTTRRRKFDAFESDRLRTPSRFLRRAEAGKWHRHRRDSREGRRRPACRTPRWRTCSWAGRTKAASRSRPGKIEHHCFRKLHKTKAIERQH